MKKLVVLVALSFVVGCADSLETEDQTDRPEISMALAAWEGAGLPDVSACPIERWARVDSEGFEAACGEGSCASGKVGACTLACTPIEDRANPVGYWNSDLHPNDVGTENVARAHEQFHAWLMCTTGSADQDHTNTVAWQAMKEIDRDLRKL